MYWNRQLRKKNTKKPSLWGFIPEDTDFNDYIYVEESCSIVYEVCWLVLNQIVTMIECENDNDILADCEIVISTILDFR